MRSQTGSIGLGLEYAFVGGSIVNLLLDDPEFAPVRPTDDVDAMSTRPTTASHATARAAIMALSFLSSWPCSEELRPFTAHAPRGTRAKLVLAERRWLVSGFCTGPADLLASSNPPKLAEELVVGLGDAPSNVPRPRDRAGDVTGCLADENGCRGGIRTYISPLNRRPLYC